LARETDAPPAKVRAALANLVARGLIALTPKPADPTSEAVERALLTIPPGWSWSLGQMMGLPPEERYRCFLSDHNTPDGRAEIHCHHDGATPVAAIVGAVEKVHRLWPETPRALATNAPEKVKG
jgi:hypothetical protein